MSQTWLDAAATVGGVQIVGLVDIDASLARAKAEANALADAAIGTDLARILAETRPDVVFDVVPPAARREVALTALRSGCHLLSEKPMAESLEDARMLVAKARAAQRLHAVVQNRRYIPGVRRIKRFLDSGALGAVHTVHCDFFVGPRFGGFREAMAHVLLLDMAIHTFDVARLYACVSPRAVTCMEWNPPNSWFADGASAIATFEFPGAVFCYRGSWCAEGLRTSWESAWRIIGTRGTLTWDGKDAMRCETVAAPGPLVENLFAPVQPVEVPPLDPRDRIGGHLGVMQDFFSAVCDGGEPETVGHENIKSLAMVLGAIESATARRRVELD